MGPIRFLPSSPSSDGACAIVLADESAAAGAVSPAWVHGCAVRTEPAVSARHDNVDPLAGRACARAAYRQAGLTDPARELDVAELFVPYSWMEPVLLENLGLADGSGGWRLIEREATTCSGPLPVNPSGGLLGANPIGAAGLVRFAEAALQVRGMAGEHQSTGYASRPATRPAATPTASDVDRRPGATVTAHPSHATTASRSS